MNEMESMKTNLSNRSYISSIFTPTQAEVAERPKALVLKTSGEFSSGVQIPPSALFNQPDMHQMTL